MFNEETVFIIGAGASWHYGFPTGEELVERVIEKAKLLPNFVRKNRLHSYSDAHPNFLESKIEQALQEGYFHVTEQRKIAWQKLCEECDTLSESLQRVRPLVIDNFLSQNPTLAPKGKILISWVILECEKQYFDPYKKAEARTNVNRRLLLKNSPELQIRDLAQRIDITKYKDDWHRFILHRLAQKPKQLLSNKVSFITFNYDVSLERSLYEGMQHIEAFDQNDIDKFISSDYFHHIYGQIHKDFKNEEDILSLFDSDRILGRNREATNPIIALRDALNISHQYSQNIFTIEDCDKIEGDKNKCKDIQEIAINKIDKARNIYILGYGFDERNSERLKLRTGLKWKQGDESKKKVYFTNYGDRNLINKKASDILLGSPKAFLPPKYIHEPDPVSNRDHYYEKSIKNVYEALEQDFDFL